LDILDDLTDEQAGMLFKAIKAHQKGEDLELSPIVKIAFSPFKNQFARDDEKYQKIVERNKNNGLKGGRPKNQDNPEKPSGLIGNPDNPRKADNKNDIDSDSDSDSDSKDPIVPAAQKRSKFKFTDDDLKFAKEMFRRIEVVAPNAKQPNFENWANTIRLMRESDNRDHKTMWAVFDWANRDSFWCSNILSPDKLRKQFDKLQVKRNETNQHRANATGASSTMSSAQSAIAAARLERDSAQSGSPMGFDGGNVHGQMDSQEWSGRVIDMD
jgi:hypothetical protein